MAENPLYCPGQHPDQHYGCHTYSQHGEDLVVLNLFTLAGIDKPGYLDLGAHHPHTISNTRLLYERGSRGVNVEANPALLRAFQVYRPDDLTLNVGVVPKGSRIDTLMMYDSTSGRNTMSEQEAARVLSKREMGPIKDRLKVPTMTIDEIVKACPGGVFPPFLSIDLEGLDYDVLNTADFSQSFPLVICAEVRRDDTSVAQLLVERDYIIHSRMGENVIFIDRSIESKVY